MPPVEVKRVTVPRTRGLLYNGENFNEVVDFYLKDRYATVNFQTRTKRIVLGWVAEGDDDESYDGHHEYLNVGDWIVQEDTEKFIVNADNFSKKFAQHPPPDHKLVNAETGREVSWEEAGTYDHR